MISDFLEKFDTTASTIAAKVKEAQMVKNLLLSRIFAI